MRSQQVTSVPMAPFDLKSTPKLRSVLHFRYSIAIEVCLEIPSLYPYFS